ncbi:uncharacterized protein LOC100207954 [Hydra vulgaris]|uniref:uncharacterized protein LOC100207954 n=1 Tax=Hydra vulgaris TaxID=6087 RepID=UPI0002B43F04|nr:uncharacterized protein LOC100207954 [Hydra vulgaris]
MNFQLLLLPYFILYISRTFSKSITGEYLTCGKEKDGSDIFKTVDGPVSCAVCLCNGDLKQGVSYKNCEICCCGYVSNTKINEYEDFEQKSINDKQELFEIKIGFYSLIVLSCFLSISLVSICLYHKKRFCSSQPPLQSTEKDEFQNGIVKVTTNHEKIQNKDKENLLPN